MHADPGRGGGGTRFARLDAALLAFALVVTAWAWAPALGLGFAGEDLAILARLEVGVEGSPHVFRPLADGWLDVLHRVFGAESAAPYHAASLVLHLVNAVLVFLLARRLFGSPLAAVTAALLFGTGAGVTDSVAWIAAVNRPLSGLGALIALNGLVRWGASPRLPGTLLAAGFVAQLLSNEEAYGTAILAVFWLAALRFHGLDGRNRGDRRAMVWAAGITLVVAAHFLFLAEAPEAGTHPGGIYRSLVRRATGIGMGFGVPMSPLAIAAWLPLLFAVAAFAREQRAVLFCLLAWLASFVPFVLSDAVGYRFYPTQAPTALLIAAAIPLASRGTWRALLCVLVCLAVLIGSHPVRTARLGEWRDALFEVRACRELAREAVRLQPERPPVLVNLETASAGPFLYEYGLGDPSTLRAVSFLDGVTGLVEPRAEPPGPAASQPAWMGRRCEGSYGVIEPERYLAGRPHVAAVRLYASGVAVASLAEARAKLADGSVDLTREAAVELDAADLAHLQPGDEPGAAIVVEPFQGDPESITGSMAVEVRAERDAILAVQEGWMYSHGLRFSPENRILSAVKEVRVVKTGARRADTGAELATFHLNAFGVGVFVPAGEYVVELSFSRLTPQELRR
ncbi:MAG: hypothetical protein O7B99_04230 [Planctomycetota bacterium]|nr:hypothetical protein [Planctomycetota bacterium]